MDVFLWNLTITLVYIYNTIDFVLHLHPQIQMFELHIHRYSAIIFRFILMNLDLMSIKRVMYVDERNKRRKITTISDACWLKSNFTLIINYIVYNKWLYPFSAAPGKNVNKLWCMAVASISFVGDSITRATDHTCVTVDKINLLTNQIAFRSTTFYHICHIHSGFHSGFHRREKKGEHVGPMMYQICYFLQRRKKLVS